MIVTCEISLLDKGLMMVFLLFNPWDSYFLFLIVLGWFYVCCLKFILDPNDILNVSNTFLGMEDIFKFIWWDCSVSVWYLEVLLLYVTAANYLIICTHLVRGFYVVLSFAQILLIVCQVWFFHQPVVWKYEKIKRNIFHYHVFRKQTMAEIYILLQLL